MCDSVSRNITQSTGQKTDILHTDILHSDETLIAMIITGRYKSIAMGSIMVLTDAAKYRRAFS